MKEYIKSKSIFVPKNKIKSSLITNGEIFNNIKTLCCENESIRNIWIYVHKDSLNIFLEEIFNTVCYYKKLDNNLSSFNDEDILGLQIILIILVK